jgi:hypothetical protein
MLRFQSLLKNKHRSQHEANVDESSPKRLAFASYLISQTRDLITRAKLSKVRSTALDHV